MVLFLVSGANVFSYFLALSTIPMQVAGWAAGLGGFALPDPTP